MYYGLVVGDSLSDVAGEWSYLLDVLPNITAVGGNALVDDIEPAFATDLATISDRGYYVIIQGGVNDCINDNSLASMQTATTSMVTAAKAEGYSVFVMGIGPWKSFASWSAGRQATTDNYNAWLSSQASVQGFTFLDIYSTLEDAADTLNAAYDSGDGLHWNSTGHNLVADIANAEINALTMPTIGGNNVIYLWRGAVQPAESSPSGNELKIWRGAVEPVGAAAFAGTISSDGGMMWLPRSGDPRWTQLITDSGITPTGNFIDDVHTALEALAGTTGQMDDLWHKVLALYGIADTSEPFTY